LMRGAGIPKPLKKSGTLLSSTLTSVHTPPDEETGSVPAGWLKQEPPPSLGEVELYPVLLMLTRSFDWSATWVFCSGAPVYVGSPAYWRAAFAIVCATVASPPRHARQSFSYCTPAAKAAASARFWICRLCVNQLPVSIAIAPSRS